MEDGYLARVHLHRYNPGKRNIFRFRGSRRSVSPRRGGGIRTKIGTKLVLREAADREKWCREMERERHIYVYNDRVKEKSPRLRKKERRKERENRGLCVFGAMFSSRRITTSRSGREGRIPRERERKEITKNEGRDEKEG